MTDHAKKLASVLTRLDDELTAMLERAEFQDGQGIVFTQDAEAVEEAQQEARAALADYIDEGWEVSE